MKRGMKEDYLKKYLEENNSQNKEEEESKERAKSEILNIEIEVENGKIVKVKSKDYISREEYEQLQLDYNLFKKIKEKGEGYSFPNYKTLCTELGLKVKTGKSKEMQLQDLQRFGTIEKIKGTNALTIKNIRKNIKQKIDKKNGIYVNLIEALLLWNFQEQDIIAEEQGIQSSYVKEFTKSELFLMLGMINENFLFKNRKEVIQNMVEELINKDLQKEKNRETSEEKMEGKEEDERYKAILTQKKINKTKEIQAFLLRVNAVLTNILTHSLNSLEKRLAINYEKITNIITKDGDKYEANEEEKRAIDDYKIEVLAEMGYNTGSKNIYFLPEKKREEFDKRYGAKILEKRRWQYTYVAYKINHTQKYLNEVIETVEKDLEKKLKRNRLSLNKKILTAIYNREEKEKERQEERHKIQQKKLKDKIVLPASNPDYIRVVKKRFPIEIDIQKKYIPYAEDFIDTHKQLAKTFLEINEIDSNKEFLFQPKDIQEIAENYGLEDCVMTKEVTEQDIEDILFNQVFQPEEGEREIIIKEKRKMKKKKGEE